ncbi:hypothetical protein FEM48_Zijuj05G0170400 [Ziziphus jujuba var. spinosa]|uniref:Uncharacterized protein n=1 Tax=Ziziphus jujuba var. spinosa TaxID=714518 RepID=A0A978VG16_ZIZJJ|nr:hypothetical protein FEM48_Zijuj05G0170400 [Ziziphus jujuba var. spinosa]
MTIAKPCLRPSTSPFQSQSSSPPPNSNPIFGSIGSRSSLRLVARGCAAISRTVQELLSILDVVMDIELFELEDVFLGQGDNTRLLVVQANWILFLLTPAKYPVMHVGFCKRSDILALLKGRYDIAYHIDSETISHFSILKQHGNNACHIDLLEDFKISLIFIVTNLTPYLPPGASPTATEPLEVEFSGMNKRVSSRLVVISGFSCERKMTIAKPLAVNVAVLVPIITATSKLAYPVRFFSLPFFNFFILHHFPSY